jgi:hypothetical protein
MGSFYEAFVLLLVGVFAITVIYSVGSITSRKWNYNYVYLSIFSFLVYTAIGYFGHRLLGNLTWSLVVAALVGIFDGTVGWKISTALNANFGKYKQGNIDTKLSDRVFGMIGVSAFFAFIGYIILDWDF